MRQIEILAPAGSMEGLEAAIYAGADAVYTGGSRFGARAFADNLDTERLKKAIDLVHLYQKKLYLTTNTLLRDEEFEGLYEMVAPLYEHGLDACIVQDLGVMNFLHRHFPDMALHASTQMTLQSGRVANLLKPFGVTRLVPARELSIEEIASCCKETDLEVEVFVHGALCYSYSGQCLMSSVIGGRSGNRGMCAQPCRLSYRSDGMEGYLLSPKDVCTLNRIPELVDAGISSFKIEGRMKKKEYAALTSMLYRKYVDFYQREGKEAFVSQFEKKDSALHRDMKKLMDVFNRGGFCGGYLFEEDKKKNMYPMKNGHFGVEVGTVLKADKKKVGIKVLEELYPQDVLELRDEKQNSVYEFTTGQGAMKGSVLESRILPGSPVRIGQKVYRRRNNQLLQEIDAWEKPNLILHGEFVAAKEVPMKLTVSGYGVEISCEGEVAQEALNRPVIKEDIAKRLCRTGDTHYEFLEMDVKLIGDLFIPMGQLNELRRNALANWEESFLQKYRKSTKEYSPWKEEVSRNQEKTVVVTVSTIEQLDEVLKFDKVSGCHIPMADFSGDAWKDAVKKVREAKKKVWISFPFVLPENWDFSIDEPVCYFINSWEMLYYLIEKNLPGEYYLDAGMHVVNKEAWHSFQKQYGVRDFTVTLDGTVAGFEDGMKIVYGRIPVMETKGCVKRTMARCDKVSGSVKIQNPKKDEFLAVSHCDYCYNTIYTAIPEKVKGFQDKTRIVFTVENKEEVRKVLREWKI